MNYPLRPLVVIPTYNERDNISQLIPAILNADSRLHILVIDDASPDHTAEEVLALKDKTWAARLHLQSRPRKLGLGSAYVQGFKWGLAKGYDFIIEMDADWSHNPADLPKMLQFKGRKFVDQSYRQVCLFYSLAKWIIKNRFSKVWEST